MSSSGRAHSASLPLFFLVKQLEKETPVIAIQKIRERIDSMRLTKDIEVVVLLNHGTHIEMEPRTKFGKLVLEELMARSEFPPCPVGDCEYDEGKLECRWCGTPKKN